MPASSLKDVLHEEIKDLYNAEGQLIKALPKMAKAAVNPELKAGFLKHLEETRGHVVRLEQVFKLLGKPAKGKLCPAMKGLIEEGSEGIEENKPSALRDAILIGSAQRVEHYEIAAYGTVRSFAEKLGEEKIAKLLQQTLDEEGATDQKLSDLSDIVNEEAFALGGNDQE
jgi:ferritin-like metal-binding protein YciE